MHASQIQQQTIRAIRLCSFLGLQEARLSHRDRTTLRFIEYSVNPLKITQGHSK